MKKLFFSILLISQFAFAQESTISSKKNEVRVDILSIIASGKLNLTYERFLDKGFSVGLTGIYSDSDKVNEDYISGYRSTLPKIEIIPFVRYNLSKSPTNFYFTEVFVAANSGDSREIVRLTDDGNGYYAIQESEYFDVAVGAGLGYKIYFEDKFGVELLVGFGTNLIDKDKSPDVISRVGLSFGYRF